MLCLTKTSTTMTTTFVYMSTALFCKSLFNKWKNIDKDIYIHTLLCTQVSNKRLDTILLSNDKSGMSTGVKIEKNANKLLLVSAFSSENMIGK